MSEKKPAARTENVCRDPQGHREHMCLLMEKGMTGQIVERTTHPAYFCRNCGARANERRDICYPIHLESS